MKILVYRWKAYNYIDIIATFKRLGYEVDEIEYHLDCYDEDEIFSEILEKKIKDNNYDFVFTVNYFGVISDVCQMLDVLYLSWSCDSPLISMYHESVFNEVNRIFLFDMADVKRFKSMGIENVFYLPLAVDTDRLQLLLSGIGEKCEIYKSEISFVGSLYEINSYDRLRTKLPDYLKGYFDAVITGQMSVSGGNIIDDFLTTDILADLEQYFNLEKSDRSFSDLGLVFKTTVLGFAVAKEFRKKALIELSKKYDVSLYTNSDTSELIRVNYRGGVDYLTEMPFVFNQSKVNLNFTIPNIETGIPLRVWDVIGSGGFLMTNYQAEMAAYFEEGKDIVCFDGIDELVEKSGFYLKNDNERKLIANRGLEKVRGEHTYINRIEKMISVAG